MSLLGDARGYGIARRTLIQALRALAPLPEGSFVLVGAQAVYLRAPEGIAAIAPFTLDGDLAADPRKIRTARSIPDHLERAGFVFRNDYGGFYSRGDASPDERYASNIDILVPHTVDHLWEAESYGIRDSRATQSQRGLELCLVDHSPMRLGSVEMSDDSGSVVVEVASILALLVAKGWKIGERLEQGTDAFQEARGDIADVYRLLRAGTPEEMAAVLRQLPRYGEVRDIARTGAMYVRNLCGSLGAGLVLLSEILGRGEEAHLILASLEVLAEDFGALVDTALQT
jgi:hypothetical protein